VISKDGLFCFLKGLVQKGMAQGADDYGTRVYRYMSLKNVEAFASPETLEEKVNQISLEGLTEEESGAVRAFQRALKRRKEGKSDDEWGRDEEED
jgi:hypothetical protein